MSRRLGRGLLSDPDRILGAAAMVLTLFIGFSLAAPGFATSQNMINIAAQSAILVLVALPMTLIVVTGGIDLSMGGVLAAASVTVAVAGTASGSLLVSIVAGLVVGTAFGFANGMVIARLCLPPVIVTLGMAGIAQGVALVLSGAEAVAPIPALRILDEGRAAEVPIPIAIALAACCVFVTIFERTRLGVYSKAIGSDRESLRLAGVDDRLILVVVYSLAGLCVGGGACLLTARLNAGHPTAALGTEFDAIAAVAIGGTPLRGGRGTVAGTVLGVMVIALLRNGLNLLSVPSSLQVVSIGALVITCLLASSSRRRSVHAVGPSNAVFEAGFLTIRPVVWWTTLAVFLAAAAAALGPSFVGLSNILNVLRQGSLVFLYSAGLTLVVIAGALDLSIAGVVALSACLAAKIMTSTGSPLLATACGVAVGVAAGAWNGLLVTRAKVPSFIATYGTLWMLTGITYALMAGQTVYGFPAGFLQLGSGYLLSIPVPVWLGALVLIAGSLLLRQTTFGHELYAVGANPIAASLSGIPVQRRLMMAFVFSGALAGAASLVLLARLDSAEGDIGDGLTLSAVAAVVIGGASLSGGTGTLVGTFLGAIVLTLILNGINIAAVPGSWHPLVSGAVVLLAAAAHRWFRPLGSNGRLWPA